MLGFEDRKITFTPKSIFEDDKFQEELFRKKALCVDIYRPQEAGFTDLYPEGEIAHDLQEIQELQAKWDNEEKSEIEIYIAKISSIYEAVIADQIEANAWFGESCHSVPASRFDDIKNGVDVVAIFDTGELRQYVGLGLDVTFSADSRVLEKKLQSIKERIRSISLPFVKYFEDPDTREHKSFFIPKVIVGSRLSSAEKLIRLWGEEGKEKNKKLAEHSMSSKLIMETIAQLMHFHKYALILSEGTKSKEDSEKYKEISLGYALIYNIFYDLYFSKKDQIEGHLGEISDDIVYETILSFTQPSRNKQ